MMVVLFSVIDIFLGYLNLVFQFLSLYKKRAMEAFDGNHLFFIIKLKLELGTNFLAFSRTLKILIPQIPL